MKSIMPNQQITISPLPSRFQDILYSNGRSRVLLRILFDCYVDMLQSDFNNCNNNSLSRSQRHGCAVRMVDYWYGTPEKLCELIMYYCKASKFTRFPRNDISGNKLLKLIRQRKDLSV